MMTTVMALDRTLGDAAAVARDSAAMKIIGPASDIADQWPLFGLCVGTAAVGAVRGDRKLVATGVRMTLSMLTATMLKNIVKDRVDRTRPFVVADGGAYVFQPGDHDVAELDSFPSGHTAGAVAVARAVSSDYPAMTTLALTAAAAIALVQLPRAKHYPTDLVAGALVGIAADAIFAIGMGWSARLMRSLVSRQ